MSVDVLAVMDSSIALLRMGEWAVKGGSDVTSWGCCPDCGAADWRGHKTGCAYADQIERHDKARAAIAELIAAAHSVNALPNSCPCELSNEEVDAWMRLNAALAAVTAQGAGSMGGEVQG